MLFHIIYFRKMFKYLFLLLLTLPGTIIAQRKILNEVYAFRNNLNYEFRDTVHSPLGPTDAKSFSGHIFYPIDLNFRIKAKFVRTADAAPFVMRASGPRQAQYVQYGKAKFTLAGKSYELPVYQNLALMSDERFSDYLFLPFTDLTNGNETYGGGRYIDLRIPKGKYIIIDFNQAYNPYCAYSDRYSCPIPPRENHLDTEIRAGVKYSERHR